MQPRQEQCVTCGTSLRRDSNPKPCPRPALIEHYLKENTGYEGSIKESDKVCYVCYRSHLVILQQRNDSSTDKDLLQLIATLSKQIPTSIKSTANYRPFLFEDTKTQTHIYFYFFFFAHTNIQKDCLLCQHIQTHKHTQHIHHG